MTANRHLTKAGDELEMPGAAITDEQIAAAINEPILIQKQNAITWRAPHFVWQVRHQLGSILCGEPNADDCPLIDTGGYQVTTTLDWKMQQVAEKWVKAAAIAPNIKGGMAATLKYLKDNKIPAQPWIRNLVGRGVFNAALGAFDYRTGQVMAYVGSAGYYASPRGKKLQPQFDVLGDGWRQPGSSFKADQLHHGHRRPHEDRGEHVHGRRHGLRRRATRRATRTSWNAARSGCARRSTSRSTSRPSRTRPRSAPTTSSPRPRSSASSSRRARTRPASRSASGPSSSTTPTSSAPTARSPTAAC